MKLYYLYLIFKSYQLLRQNESYCMTLYVVCYFLLTVLVILLFLDIYEFHALADTPPPPPDSNAIMMSGRTI